MALGRRIAGSSVPVMVWVGPAGATAEGGSVLLAEASGLTSIAPGAGIGDLQPLDLRDANAPVTDEVRSQIDTWGETFDHGTGLPQIENSLLSSQDAIDAGLTPVLQPGSPAPQTVLSFLEQVDGHQVMTVNGPVQIRSASSTDPAAGEGTIVGFKSLGPFVRALHAVASPTAVFLLLSLGAAGIAFELTQPGFGFAGISGVIATLLGIYGMTAVPPAPLGLALFVAGTLGMILDVRWKRLSALTWGGLVAYAASGFLLYPDAAPAIAISPWFIGVLVIAAGLYYAFALTVAQQAHDRISDMQQALVGLPGEVRNDLDPIGGVVVKGTVWRARAIGEHVRAGERIRVKSVQGLVLQVEPDPAAGPSPVEAPADPS